MPLPLWLRALRLASPRRAGRDRPRKLKPRLLCESLDDRLLPSFLSPVNYPADSYPQAVVTGDFNGDGKLDLATAGNNGSVSVLLGNGDGTFQNAMTSPAGYGTLSLAVGDFNKDGKLDVATANYSNVQVLLGNGDGTFQAPTDIDVSSSPTSVAVGDFNGDGKLDLGVTSNIYYIDGYYWGYYGYYQYGHYEGHANVLLGDGSGGFASPNVSDLGYSGYSGFNLATAADVNGDGLDDFVTANEYYGTVDVWLGDSSGSLLPGSSNYVGDYLYAVAAGDLNGDGHTDLVSANYYGASVRAFLGDGTGSFASAGNFAVASNPTGVVLGDFTGDGKVDVVTANYWANSVSLLYGANDGTFSAPINFASGSNPFRVAAGDFNADGWLDAATGNSGNGTVSVLMNDQSWPEPPAPFVNVNDVTVTEGNTGSVNATFTVSLSVASNHDVTVHYATSDGSAAGSDYSAASGDLTIPAGQTSATFSIAVTGDRNPEDTENFFINLSAPTNAFIGDGQGTGTILDNEPRISISDVSKNEGNGNGKSANTAFIFTFTLSNAYDQAVTVNFATADGTAKLSNSDYVAASGTVTFAPGETSKTITVQVRGDKTKEPDEYFLLNLSGQSTNAFLLDSQGVGWILDDDRHGRH
jgi:hypothetical protein